MALCPACKTPLLKRNINRHIERYAYKKGNQKHIDYLKSIGAYDPAKASGSASGSPPIKEEKGQTPSGSAEDKVPPPLSLPKPPTPGVKDKTKATEGTSDDLKALDFKEPPPTGEYIAPGVAGEVLHDVPYDNTEIAVQFGLDLSAAFAEGELKAFKMTKAEVRAFAKALAQKRGKDLEAATLIYITGSKLIITILGNVFIGVSKMLQKMKDKKALKEKELAEAKKKEEAKASGAAD